MPATVSTFRPAITVTVVVELIGTLRQQRKTQPRFDLGLEGIEPAMVDGVLQSRMFALGPVTPVALGYVLGSP
jgi:hypothetical protein